MDYAWGANGLDAIITQVKLGYNGISCPFVQCCKIVSTWCDGGGQTTEGGETGDHVRSAGGEPGRLNPAIKGQILCAAELTPSFCLLWPIVFSATKSV